MSNTVRDKFNSVLFKKVTVTVYILTITDPDSVRGNFVKRVERSFGPVTPPSPTEQLQVLIAKNKQLFTDLSKLSNDAASLSGPDEVGKVQTQLKAIKKEANNTNAQIEALKTLSSPEMLEQIELLSSDTFNLAERVSKIQGKVKNPQSSTAVFITSFLFAVVAVALVIIMNNSARTKFLLFAKESLGIDVESFLKEFFVFFSKLYEEAIDYIHNLKKVN